MRYTEKNNLEVKDGDTLLFTLKDEVEPTGFNKYALDVKLCYWSENEKRYIPFQERYDHAHIKEAEKITLRTKQ